MKSSYVRTGRLVSPNQVHLDESLPLEGSAVRVTVELIENHELKSVSDVLAQIRQRQHERGFIPPSVADIDKYVTDERNSWV